ncbi:TetR family transcriptional regulator [Solirubrobacter ginsenosidimutans]|uniref:TetR family transcriptional regulator n=1 Tax=Solirubrobacter ginsenosidimutans TaxID=490573 RepID=UPI003557952F
MSCSSRILDAAPQLFCERGVHAVSVNEIAACAPMSDRGHPLRRKGEPLTRSGTTAPGATT